MRLYSTELKFIAFVGAVLFSLTVAAPPVWCTAELDDGASADENRGPTRRGGAGAGGTLTGPAATEAFSTAPQVVPSAEDEVGSEPATAASSAATSAAHPGQPTYSIRLPLATPGSVIPRIEAGTPASSPPHPYMPTPQADEFKRPVAWRAIAEANRNQPPSTTLIVCTVKADFKTTYNMVFEEAQNTGWGITAFSQPAGHILLRLPPSTDFGSGRDDSAAWLVVTVSPLDSASAELRIKIQARRGAASHAAAVNGFVQRCQMKATGTPLL